MLAPGTVHIRPTREDAEESIDLFYELFETIRECGDLPLKLLAELTGDTTENPVVNFCKRVKNRSLSPEARRKILRYIYEEAKLLTGPHAAPIAVIKDFFYFAFLNFAGIKETSQDKSRARVLGTYRFWRPSVEHDGEYVFGKIEFTECPDTRALKARMVQVRRAAPDDPGAREEFTGYLFRVSHMHMLFLWDEITKDIRITLLKYAKPSEVGTDVSARSPFKGRIKHIVWMDGFVMGVDGDKVFFSPLHMSLVDDIEQLAELEDRLDIIAEHDPRLPPRVLKKLQRSGPLRRL